jgi:hypothetical protein
MAARVPGYLHHLVHPTLRERDVEPMNSSGLGCLAGGNAP